jgi:hypothetical protein
MARQPAEDELPHQRTSEPAGGLVSVLRRKARSARAAVAGQILASTVPAFTPAGMLECGALAGIAAVEDIWNHLTIACLNLAVVDVPHGHPRPRCEAPWPQFLNSSWFFASRPLGRPVRYTFATW